MKLKQLMNYEVDKNKKSSLQVKAIKTLGGFLILMFLLTILSRAADSLTIAKVTAIGATGNTISHNIETDGTVTANKDLAVSTCANIKIASVEALEGKSVKKDDLLIQLDMDDLKKKLLQAEKDLAILEATAHDKAANDAIADRNEKKNKDRLYEDYKQTVSDANDIVKKAKKDMDDALDTYNKYKKSSGSSTPTDTTVRDTLVKAINEKQSVYDQAVNALDGVKKDIEADVQEAIDAASFDEEGNPIELTQQEKQKIRNEINALPANVALTKEAEKAVDKASAELAEAESALSVYESEQSSNNQTSFDEQLKMLYDDYKAKKDAYNEAKKQKDATIKAADRGLEDANAPDVVDTASALTENNDLELKQLEVDQLQKLMDVEGKILAPTDGLITKVLVTTGETTTEDTAIRIADQSSGYKFTAMLDKSSAKYLEKGDKVTLDIGNGGSLGNIPIENINVSPEDKNTYEITISIPASTAKQLKNLSGIATMRVDKASKKYGTCVPLNALHSDGDNYYVYVISEKETILGIETAVDKVQVEVLDKNNEFAAIEGYFDWNQQFVLTSSKTLRSGDRVRLLEEQ